MSWSQNLKRRPGGSFWGDARWYDLHLEVELPLAAESLNRLIFSLPPLGSNSIVADLGSGSGRAALAVRRAYPEAELNLYDASSERLSIARSKILGRANDISAPLTCYECTLTCENIASLPGPLVDVIIAQQVIRHVVCPPSHYRSEDAEAEGSIDERYSRIFAGIFGKLKPGGHLLIADHVETNHPTVYGMCALLDSAGFVDVDCAYRNKDWFVVGGRKAPA